MSAGLRMSLKLSVVAISTSIRDGRSDRAQITPNLRKHLPIADRM